MLIGRSVERREPTKRQDVKEQAHEWTGRVGARQLNHKELGPEREVHYPEKKRKASPQRKTRSSVYSSTRLTGHTALMGPGRSERYHGTLH